MVRLDRAGAWWTSTAHSALAVYTKAHNSSSVTLITCMWRSAESCVHCSEAELVTVVTERSILPVRLNGSKRRGGRRDKGGIFEDFSTLVSPVFNCVSLLMHMNPQKAASAKETNWRSRQSWGCNGELREQPGSISTQPFQTEPRLSSEYIIII